MGYLRGNMVGGDANHVSYVPVGVLANRKFSVRFLINYFL